MSRSSACFRGLAPSSSASHRSRTSRPRRAFQARIRPRPGPRIGAFDGLLPPRLLRGVAIGYALSRPYLGVHYPFDVLAGALLGAAIGEAGRRRSTPG
ncbi:MAG: phosphatase PAP2 family protein [Solirubrobacteraceae bacterium]